MALKMPLAKTEEFQKVHNQIVDASANLDIQEITARLQIAARWDHMVPLV